jgi:hypothetical protein
MGNRKMAPRLVWLAAPIAILFAVLVVLPLTPLPRPWPHRAASSGIPSEWRSDVRAARSDADAVVREALSDLLGSTAAAVGGGIDFPGDAETENSCFDGEQNFKVQDSFRLSCQLTRRVAAQVTGGDFRSQMLRLGEELTRAGWEPVQGGIAQMIIEYWDPNSSQPQLPTHPRGSYGPEDLPGRSYRRPTGSERKHIDLHINWGASNAAQTDGEAITYEMDLSVTITYFRR